MKPLLLINRDSLLILKDKEGDVSNFTDFSFAPHAFSSLHHLAQANRFDLVMIEPCNELNHLGVVPFLFYNIKIK